MKFTVCPRAARLHNAHFTVKHQQAEHGSLTVIDLLQKVSYSLLISDKST